MHTRTRDLSIDIAKGIGILLIYFAHAVNECFPKSVIVAFHVPLFFFISGFLYRSGRYNFKSFFSRRVKSILIPLISFTFLGLIIGLPLGLYEFSIFEYDFLPAHWFLFILFVVEMISFFITKLNHTQIVLVVFLLSIIGFLVPQRFMPHSFNSVFHCSAFYLIGFLFGYRWNKHINYFLKKYCFVIFPLSLLVLCSMVFFFKINMDLKTNVMKGGYLLYFSSVVGILGTFALSNYLINFRILRSVLGYLGKISICILGLHLILFGVVVHFKSLFPSSCLYAIFKLSVPLFLCCIFALITEKKYFKYLLGKW